ncbi:hypothetical protein CRUP_025894 [Coryphaenoides rupestris]|nr:hypothetical protein CRUP_025894 [Coryphaenoides rupestris]
METIPFTEGMADLLAFISAHKSAVDCVVVSDSNTVFIDWDPGCGGAALGPSTALLTNPARFDERGYLRRKALEQYLAERAAGGGLGLTAGSSTWGDGGNDLCPTSCLGGDVGDGPRRGFTLEGLLSIAARPGGSSPLKARVVPWAAGTEVLGAESPPWLLAVHDPEGLDRRAGAHGVLLQCCGLTCSAGL